MPTPSWQAARNGLPGDTNATDKSAQINQFLGTHASGEIYHGKTISSPSAGTGVYPHYSLSTFDYDQPFTMSGTAIGRVMLPITPVGDGADLQVSLYTNSGGVPGTKLATTRIPAKWITAVAAYGAQVDPSTYTPVAAAGALALPQYSMLRVGSWSDPDWASPAVSSAGGATQPRTYGSGDYLITAGGENSASAPVASVFTTLVEGGALTSSVPQPSMPQVMQSTQVVTTTDTLVVAGGYSSGQLATVYTAPWDVGTGTVGAWSAQANLPQALSGAACAADGETVYVVGGFGSASTALNTFYYATVQNGQITAWNTGPALPTAAQAPFALVAGNFLIVGGGLPTSGSAFTAIWYIALDDNGNPLGTWQNGPALATGVGEFSIPAGTGGLVLPGGLTSTTPAYTAQVQTLTWGPTGPGDLVTATCPFGTLGQGTIATPLADGMWQMNIAYNGDYYTAPLYAIPLVSVPLPATGLTNGATYHIVLHQEAADLNDYLLTWLEADSALDGVGESAPGANSWTYYSGFAIPLTVYDQTVSGQVWHTWEDSGARISLLAYTTTPDARLLGALESTLLPDGTCDACGWTVNYPTGALWPPTGITQL